MKSYLAIQDLTCIRGSSCCQSASVPLLMPACQSVSLEFVIVIRCVRIAFFIQHSLDSLYYQLVPDFHSASFVVPPPKSALWARAALLMSPGFILFPLFFQKHLNEKRHKDSPKGFSAYCCISALKSTLTSFLFFSLFLINWQIWILLHSPRAQRKPAAFSLDLWCGLSLLGLKSWFWMLMLSM